MNILIILLFVCYVSAESESTTGPAIDQREELLKIAEQLYTRARAEIVKLQIEKREHLAILLGSEEWNVKMVYNELHNSRPDATRLVFLEAELTRLNYRITKEISIIERNTVEQNVLLSIAQALKKWAEQEMKILEVQNNMRAHEAYQHLQNEVTTLNFFIDQLAKTEDIEALERTEVALRGVETRINDILRRLGTNQIIATPANF